MAVNLVRASLKPSAGAWETLYTAAAPTVLSTIRACVVSRNQTDRIWIRRRIAGETAADEHIFVAGYPVSYAVPYAQTEGDVLLEDDCIDVLSEHGQTAFNLSGSE